MSEPTTTSVSATRARRWPRILLAGLAALVLLLGAALWLLGRESTLQTILKKVADASGGQIAVSGVSGSLYGRMHLDRLRYRSAGQAITADQIDIDWSPFQYLSDGIVINSLRLASLTVESIGPSEPATLPASLAPPFRIKVEDARLGRLTLLNKGASTVIDNVRLSVHGDRASWRVQQASAGTPWGQVAADATIGAQRPFTLAGKASLSQTTQAAAPNQPAPQLSAEVGGNLSLIALTARASARQANGSAALTLAPFAPIILRKADITGTGIDPARFNPAWPQAELRFDMKAEIAPDQTISGSVALTNQGTPGPLDQQRLPLRAVSGQLRGSLTATRLEAVSIDLGEAGKLSGKGSVARTGPEAGVASATFGLHTDRIDLKAIQSSMKRTAIAGDITLGSDSQGGAQVVTLNALLAEQGLRLDLQATLADALLQVRQARLQAGKGSVNASGQVSLKDKQAFTLKASASRFNPADFGAYPVADLNADVTLNGSLQPQWQVAADVALRPSRIFNQALGGGATLSANPSHISAVQAKLNLGQNVAELRGSFGAPGEQLTWRIDAKQLAAARSDLRGSLVAKGVVTGTMAAPRTSFEADARGLALLPAGAGAAAKRAPPDSVLHASGEVALAAGAERKVDWKVAGQAQRLNPAAFGAYPNGSIGADFKANGRLAKDWRLTLDLALQPSTLANAPLTGYAKFDADAVHIDGADINLRLGPNSATARGAFGAARDRLDWKIDAPQLAAIGPQFGGALQGSGVLSGTSGAPALALNLDGKQLRLFGEHQIKTLRASATLGSGQGAADPLVSEVDVVGYSSPALSLAGARLQTAGTRAAHSIAVSARNDDIDVSAQVRGGWNAGQWSGAVESLQNRGRLAFALQAPAPLRLAGAPGSGVAGLLHPQQLSLSNAVIKLADGTLNVQSLDKTGPRWRSSGQAAAVPLSYLTQLSPAWRDNASSDLTLGAQWSLDLQAASAAQPDAALAGMLHVYREQGDVTIGADVPLALGLRKLDARFDVAAGALRMQFELDGSRAGQARVDGTVRLRQGRVANDSALNFTGSANMASLGWLAPLTGQQGLELDGVLRLAVAGGGTVGSPVLNGDINGEKLTVSWADQGLKLRNGVLQAKLAGDQLQLQRLSFDGSEGRATADGWVRFAGGEASMQLKLVADQLQALSRPDRRLTLSGQSTLTRDAKRFQLDGKFKAERALIELAAQDTPTLSDDVVVLGRAGAGAAPGATAAPSLPLNIDLEVDLGDDFQLRGKGLDAKLDGNVRVRVLDRRAPRAIGNIRVVSGTYAAYGQKLSIERGLLNFTGAYDNPGLNILAVRKRPEDEPLSETNVEAGVEVRGTALAPTAKLVSIPSVPDSEKLAWLVLGHGTEGTASDELGLLSTAAGALFGGGGGGGSLQTRLANSLGLDEVGVGQKSGAGATQAKGLENTVLTVGKRISQRAYLSFEQGASTASSLVKLRYKLNPRISLQFQTGTNNALDVLYTWAFD
ncbi:MAG: translocation/assembly module TamB domain-containing protein [Pseudomonadota bacterium]